MTSIASLQGLETFFELFKTYYFSSSIASLQGLETFTTLEAVSACAFFNSLPPRIGNEITNDLNSEPMRLQ